MRLSIARVSAAGDHTPGDSVIRDDAGFGVRGAARRRMALALAVALILGCIGLLFGSSKPAGADTPIFASGQVFASVGNSAVNVYSAGSGNPQVTRLNDGLDEPYTAGSAFDSSGNFYVTDDYSGDVSEYAPDGTLDGVFASGLQNPLSLAFDNQGNLYVGQQTTPYIAEFSKTGQLVQNIGPVATELSGDDWIALGADECTFYYTTEETDILRYNMCTNQQEPNFNVQPFASYDPSTGLPVQAFQLQVLPDGDVLVADSNADILLDQNGNVLQTYTCASLPGCQGSLFAMSLDPDGTSFWTGDSVSGNVWEVDIATGAVQQQIDTNSGTLYGLSVDDEIEVAAPAPVTTAAPSTLTVAPVTGDFSTPTPVSAVLTNPTTDAPIVGEPVTFTLNGSETCTADTDTTGTATCDITAGEPSSSYTLTASFPGDTTTSTPIGSDSSTTTFTVNPDTSSLTYTGSTSAVNGQPVTLSGTLTTDNPTPGTPLPTKVVTFTIGSGSTAQSCSDTTDVNGNVSCTIATVDQPSGTEPINASFTGDSYDTPAPATSSLSVTEPTVLTVNPVTVTYGGSTTVSGTLTDSNLNQPIANEPVTFVVNNTETCTGTTDSDGHRLLSHHARRVGRDLLGERDVHRGHDAARPADDQHQLGGLRGDSRADDADVHRSHLHHQRPAGGALRRPHDRKHAAGQPAGHLDPGVGQLGPDVSRGDDDGHGRRQLHHCLGQPARRPEPGQRHLSRDEQLPADRCDEHRPGGPHRGVHHPDGDLDHRDLRQPDHGDGHAGQQLHEHASERRDRDPQAERDAVLHGDDERLRGGDVLHHAVGAGGELHVERVVRR